MTLEIVGNVLLWVIAGGLVLAGVLAVLLWIKDKTKRISVLRIVVQVVSVIGFFYLFTTILWLFVVFIVIVALTILLGKLFCGWICPLGLYMDVISLVRKALKIGHRNLPEKLNRGLDALRYVILGVILALPFFSGPLYLESWLLAMFFSGPFRPLGILLGPLEPLIVPWTGYFEFNGLSLSYPYIRDVIEYSSEAFVQINVILFIALTLVAVFFVRRAWCRFCPLGITLAIGNKFRGFRWAPVVHLDKEEEKCTKCGICKRVCPTQVTAVYEKKGGNVTTSMCIHCFRCVEMCPYEDCLKVKLGRKTVLKSRNWLEPSEVE